MTTFLFLYPVYIVLVPSKFSYKSLNVLIFPPTEWSILEIEGVLARREEPWYLSIYLLSNRSGDWRQTSNIKLSICLLTPEWRQQVLAEGALDTVTLRYIMSGEYHGGLLMNTNNRYLATNMHTTHLQPGTSSPDTRYHTSCSKAYTAS